MGVTGLWTVLQPCARPIKLETLNKKRLAVDASIWIYQFLKAVRDKEGNALRNSHVVGFFRRICKLLFFGIKPVFVFDGGAPALKRQTISNRKRRREGRREDAVRTAGKLLAVQMQRRAEEEQERRRLERNRNVPADDEEELPDELVYVDELQMTQQERQRNRQFKKKDQYHLPDLDMSLEDMGAPDDPRVMSHEELEEYARQFHSGEDINLYDFSKIDFNSLFFLSLPASDRYNILNAARLRSRLRMGYSKDQLDTMFPDRMAFSKFQIDRVKERNDLTQRLMNLNGMNGENGIGGGGRVAGERGKEYVLVKNEGVEGGWALGVLSSKETGERNKPITVEDMGKIAELEGDDEEWEDDDEGFEDVPIEGLNRLPIRRTGQDSSISHDIEQLESDLRRHAPHKSGKKHAEGPAQESLFIDQDPNSPQSFSNLNSDTCTNVVDNLATTAVEDDGDLDLAIAMSLEDHVSPVHEADQQIPVRLLPESSDNLVAKGSGFGTAVNLTAQQSISFTNTSDNGDSDSDMDLQAALAESRQSKYHSKQVKRVPTNAKTKSYGTQRKSFDEGPFSGPLPFEKLDFTRPGTSPSGKEPLDDAAGGFQRSNEQEQKHKALPLPPWFSAEVRGSIGAQTMGVEHRSDVTTSKSAKLDLDGHRIMPESEREQVISVDSSDNEDQEVTGGISTSLGQSTQSLSMDDVATLLRAEPQVASNALVSERDQLQDTPLPTANEEEEELLEWEDSDHDEVRSKGLQNAQLPDKGTKVAFNQSLAESPMLQHSGPDRQSTSHVEPVANGLDLKITNNNSMEAAEEISDGIEEEPTIDAGELYSDPEDDELMKQLATEAEEHARFASTLNHKSQLQNQEDYERELRALRNQQKKDRRDADEVSNVMITECQQLLKLFGLPYITAPMEAEAQCAELVRLGLVDGIVTDDSDCFLFGGTRIYKNMFNQAKFVECYLASDLEKEFDLDRDKLIGIAHLLGSDYTEGIPGIGPVTALEILSEFNSPTGLEDFKAWLQAVQMGTHSPEDAKSPFRKKFRRSATRIFLPPSFPSVAVTQAYQHPEVDSSPEPFQWGIPDLDSLRSFLMATIGWTQERTDEVLVPVIRDMNRRETEGTQSNLTAFFSGGSGAGAFAPRKKSEGSAKRGKMASKRLEGALGKLKEGAKRKSGSSGAAEGTGDGDDEVEAFAPVERKKRRPENDGIASSDSERESAGTNRSGRSRQSGAKGVGRGQGRARARARTRTRT